MSFPSALKNRIQWVAMQFLSHHSTTSRKRTNVKALLHHFPFPRSINQTRAKKTRFIFCVHVTRYSISLGIPTEIRLTIPFLTRKVTFRICMPPSIPCNISRSRERWGIIKLMSYPLLPHVSFPVIRHLHCFYFETVGDVLRVAGT